MDKFIVSARKYRPQAFDTVVGQEHITTTLKNAIRNHQLAHAFLFCGPRGVGKTTCARILAKTINCEHPSAEGEACNTCTSCISFNEGISMNIHELDAASNNSVDDIRSLVEQVRFAPQAGKYKVYIIDEVHMLSSSAFNAFLKTLEEPPPYAIFILATTEKHKILPTILSRCQIFDFKRITLQDTVEHLKEIAVKENIKAEDTALQLIAQKSEGCMRDALSILDKIVSFTNRDVTYNNTIEHLNILDEDYYFKLADCMLEQDLSGALLLYDDIDKKGFEGDMVLNGLASFCRNLLICKDERVAVMLDVVESFKQRYTAMAARMDAAYLISVLNLLNEAEIHFKAARNKRLHVELTLIKLCYLQQALEISTAGSGVIKKKSVENARPVAFRNIQPVKFHSSEKTIPQRKEPKLTIIGEKPEKKIQEKKLPETPATETAVSNGKEKVRLGSLDDLRRKIEASSQQSTQKKDLPLEPDSLQNAWKAFIVQLKQDKNPASPSFELSELHILDPNCFEAVVFNNINQKFLEFERNKVSDFLQRELKNSQLQFTIRLVENKQEVSFQDMPLSAKEQFMKLSEQYPLVKELKDRLRLELDF